MKKCRLLLLLVVVAMLMSACGGSGKKDKEKADKKKIFTEDILESKFDKDPNVPENIIEVTNKVVKVKVLEKNDTQYFFKELAYPYTKYKVQLLDVIKGDIKDVKEVYNSGGDVKLDAYINYLKDNDPEAISTRRLDKVTDDQAKNEYVRSNFDYNYNLAEGQEYLLVINDEGRIVDNGYGIFATASEVDGKENTTSSKSNSDQATYKNVISKNEFPKELLNK